nr:unnamed protein product [Spirometra erinaceieuropaei]
MMEEGGKRGSGVRSVLTFGEFASSERQAEVYQTIIDALQQTGQSSHDFVQDGKVGTCVSSLCLGETVSEEDVAGIHLLQLTLFGESGLAVYCDVHFVACQLPSH